MLELDSFFGQGSDTQGGGSGSPGCQASSSSLNYSTNGTNDFVYIYDLPKADFDKGYKGAEELTGDGARENSQASYMGLDGESHFLTGAAMIRLGESDTPQFSFERDAKLLEPSTTQTSPVSAEQSKFTRSVTTTTYKYQGGTKTVVETKDEDGAVLTKTILADFNPVEGGDNQPEIVIDIKVPLPPSVQRIMDALNKDKELEKPEGRQERNLQELEQS